MLGPRSSHLCLLQDGRPEHQDRESTPRTQRPNCILPPLLSSALRAPTSPQPCWVPQGLCLCRSPPTQPPARSARPLPSMGLPQPQDAQSPGMLTAQASLSCQDRHAVLPAECTHSCWAGSGAQGPDSPQASETLRRERHGARVVGTAEGVAGAGLAAILTLAADQALQHPPLLLQGLGDGARLHPSICRGTVD